MGLVIVHAVVGALLLVQVPAPAERREPRVTVEAPPGLAGVVRRIEAMDLGRLEEALARAGLNLPDRIRILLADNDHPLARSTPSWVVGLASGTQDIAVFPDRVLRFPYDSLESVVRHEVVHLALSARAAGRPLPRWFHEGVAVSVDAGFGVGSQLRLVTAMLGAPGIADLNRLFRAMTQPDTADAYLLSTALVDHLRRQHGAAVPGAIAARVAQGAPFAEAFVLETGTTPDQAAVEAWSAYRRWVAWIPSVTSASATWALIMLLALVAFLARVRRRRRLRRRWDDEDAWAEREI
jgi:hypothetical protein